MDRNRSGNRVAGLGNGIVIDRKSGQQQLGILIESDLIRGREEADRRSGCPKSENDFGLGFRNTGEKGNKVRRGKGRVCFSADLSSSLGKTSPKGLGELSPSAVVRAKDINLLNSVPRHPLRQGI